METQVVMRFFYRVSASFKFGRRHIFVFRCLLTCFFFVIIHQWISHFMRIVAVCLDLQETGVSSRKAIFSVEVSDFFVLSPSLFMFSMPSHHLFRLYHTSIDATFDADFGTALGSVGNRRLDL